MNRIAKRRLLIVAVVGAVLTTGTGGLYAWRKERTNARFRDLRAEGMAAAVSGNFPLAVGDLQQYLIRYANDADALAVYCKVRPKVVSADRSHLRETMTALRYYVSLKPDAVDERRALLKLYLDYGLNTEALDVADRLLVAEPNNSELLAARTQALGRLRRTNEALATAQHWAEIAPLNTTAQRYRIELMKLSGIDDTTILADVDALVAAHPDVQGLQIVRGQALIQQADRVEEARKALKAASQLPGGSSTDIQGLAELMDRVGLFDDAVALLTQLAETDQGDGEATRISLARRLWECGNADGFLQLVDKHPAITATEPDLLAIHGLLLRRGGRQAEGDADLAKLNADSSNPIAKAWSAVVGASDTSVTAANAKRQIDLVSDALIDRPNDAYLLYFLGEAYAQTGDLELAISTWQRSGRNAPAWAIPPMRASAVLASQGRFEEAMDYAAVAASRSARIAVPNYLQIWTASVESGHRPDGADLLKVLDNAMTQAPGQDWLHVARATTLAALRQKIEAKEAIQHDLQDTSLKFDQNALLRLQALSRVYALGLDDALAKRLRDDFGSSADASMTDFFRAFLGDNRATALEGFEKARLAADNPESKPWLLADARIRDFLRNPQSIDSWTKLLAKHGDDVEVIQSALASSSLWRDRTTVDKLIEKLRDVSGERGLSWRLHRAHWLVEGSTDQAPDIAATQRAADLLTAVLTVTPDAVAALFWQARCQSRLGNRGSAVEHLLTATRLSPRSAPIALYAAQLLQEQGDLVRAFEQVNRLSTEDLTDPEQNAMAAQLLAQQGKPQQAIELIEQNRNLGITKQTDLLLALLYQRQGEYEKTDAIITRLLQQPTLTTVAFAADFYRSRGKTDLAERTLEKLRELQLDPGVREMTLADYYLRSNDLTQAKKYGEAATVAAPLNVAAWRGLLLSQLQAGDIDAANLVLTAAAAAMPADAYIAEARSDAIWPLLSTAREPTRRLLALALAADPKNEPARQALTLLKDVKGRADSKCLDDLRSLADRFPRSLPLQVVTSQLLLDAGQNARAAVIATRGAEAFPTDGALPRLAAQAMLASGEWSQARTFGSKWRVQAGADVLAPDLLAALASFQMGNAADAEALLRPHVSYAVDRLEVHGDLIRTFALALYATGKESEAQQLVDQCIARRPFFAVEWLDAAGSNLSTPQAIYWMRKLDAQLTDPDGATLLTRVWLQVALRPDAPPDAASIVSQRVMAGSAREDLTPKTVLILAIIADQIDQDALADKLYRQVIAAEPSQSIALNNLAMLLLNARKQLAEADTLTQKAVEAAPDTAAFFDTRAQVLLALNKVADARTAIDAGLKLDLLNLFFRLTSAEVSVAEGKLQDAAAAVEAIRREPNVKLAFTKEELSRLDRLSEQVSTVFTPPN